MIKHQVDFKKKKQRKPHTSLVKKKKLMPEAQYSQE